MTDHPAKFGAEDLRQLAWRNSYLKSKDEQEYSTTHPIPRVTKFGIKRDSLLANKTTLPPLVEECIPSVARHGVFNNEPMPKNPWYKRRTSLPSSIAYKHQHQRNSIEFNYPSTQHFGIQGKKPVQMLPVATNMMSSYSAQPSLRRASLPATMQIRSSEYTNTSLRTAETQIELQKDNVLLSKRKKSYYINPE